MVLVRSLISRISATKLLPPEVGAQYTRLLPVLPHSSAAACHGYISCTPFAAYACSSLVRLPEEQKCTDCIRMTCRVKAGYEAHCKCCLFAPATMWTNCAPAEVRVAAAAAAVYKPNYGN